MRAGETTVIGASGALLAGTPWALVVTLLSGLVVCAAVVAAGGLPGAALRVVAIAVAHGGMLATAIAWSDRARLRDDLRAPVAAVALIGLGATGAAAHDVGAIAYIATPLWIARLSVTGRLVALGLGTPAPPGALALGALLGAFLGGHMLLSAMLTLGYRPLAGGIVPVLPALAYDVGAQALGAECFFHGALFNRAQRRWSFAAACGLSTGVWVVRYLVDPLLPRSVEVVAGMVFYVALLGIGNCWLLWRYGTLVPGLVATLLFFAAYRVLTAG